MKRDYLVSYNVYDDIEDDSDRLVDLPSLWKLLWWLVRNVHRCHSIAIIIQ